MQHFGRSDNRQGFHIRVDCHQIKVQHSICMEVRDVTLKSEVRRSTYPLLLPVRLAKVISVLQIAVPYVEVSPRHNIKSLIKMIPVAPWWKCFWTHLKVRPKQYEPRCCQQLRSTAGASALFPNSAVAFCRFSDTTIFSAGSVVEHRNGYYNWTFVASRLSIVRRFLSIANDIKDI